MTLHSAPDSVVRNSERTVGKRNRSDSNGEVQAYDICKRLCSAATSACTRPIRPACETTSQTQLPRVAIAVPAANVEYPRATATHKTHNIQRPPGRTGVTHRGFAGCIAT